MISKNIEPGQRWEYSNTIGSNTEHYVIEIQKDTSVALIIQMKSSYYYEVGHKFHHSITSSNNSSHWKLLEGQEIP